ncbi:hypothetical protein [Pseudoteredinibacter isoporae]|uniref:Uncharacterized protein n=1 Tax=Pseudoteredinibacter isoporae TaxID=570281 RepID=A0A7X0JSZ1_9GAMM|nr:hypothetical protein [Pseudoteredinibacter isoporae]MBB6521572.1 hypothetical protein [Pseudoteredinibacter isoporae]NHO87126.1 hypothetical protein [Pseudoteredinibacter isoporae]NIB22950.1 hypothetical protein [Pseudoteredinibacter isoporae]
MDTVLFEIVELANGDVALQRADDKGEPLLTIHFSEESNFYLQDAKIEVARAMVQAGLEAASEIAEANRAEEGIEDIDEADQGPVQIH